MNKVFSKSHGQTVLTSTTKLFVLNATTRAPCSAPAALFAILQEHAHCLEILRLCASFVPRVHSGHHNELKLRD
jgi:hypothetical protein